MYNKPISFYRLLAMPQLNKWKAFLFYLAKIYLLKKSTGDAAIS